MTVANTAASAVSISQVQFSGDNAADFSESDTCVGSLDAGASCTINITFTNKDGFDAKAGATATLQIVANASSSSLRLLGEMK